MPHEEQQEQQQLTGPSLILQTHGRIKQTITVTPSSSEDHKYFLSVHRIKRPDIQLHIGKDDSGPLAAVSYIRSWSRVYHIGISNSNDDSSNEASMQWVDCKSKVHPKEPTFEWEGTTYILRRKKWNFEARDAAGRLVASYSPVGKVSASSGAGKGVLQFTEGTSEAVEKVIILGICSWREEMRRAG